MRLSSQYDPIRCHYKALLILLVLSATACSGDWWASEPPCSNGAVLTGSPPSSHINPSADADFSHAKWSVQCVSPKAAEFQMTSEIQGRFQAWYANGQVKHQGVYLDGLFSELRMWDFRGRLTLKQDAEGMQHTLWHHNGQKAYHGRSQWGQPIGLWTIWNEAGTQVAKLDFKKGRTEASPSQLSTIRNLIYRAHHPFDSYEALPQTQAHEPPELLPQVTITKEAVTLNERGVLALKDWVPEDSERRGWAIPSLSDALNEQYEISRLIEERLREERYEAPLSDDGDDNDGGASIRLGEIGIHASKETPWPILRDVLFNAGLAKYDSFYVLAQSNGLFSEGQNSLAVINVRLPQIGYRDEFETQLMSPKLTVKPSHLIIEPPQSNREDTPATPSLEDLSDQADITNALLLRLLSEGQQEETLDSSSGVPQKDTAQKQIQSVENVSQKGIETIRIPCPKGCQNLSPADQAKVKSIVKNFPRTLSELEGRETAQAESRDGEMDDSSQSIVFSMSNGVTLQELIAVIDLTRADDGTLMYPIIHVAGSVEDD